MPSPRKATVISSVPTPGISLSLSLPLELAPPVWSIVVRWPHLLSLCLPFAFATVVGFSLSLLACFTCPASSCTLVLFDGYNWSETESREQLTTHRQVGSKFYKIRYDWHAGGRILDYNIRGSLAFSYHLGFIVELAEGGYSTIPKSHMN
jgi:hypothetical protein